MPEIQWNRALSEHSYRVIALTGLPSSGKGEVTKVLRSLAESQGWGFGHLVFSDQIREEARNRGIPESSFNRDVLSRIGTELREKEGPGVLALRIARKIRSWPEPIPRIFVADGVRHVGEVNALKEAFGPAFVLVAVESEPREIARRLIARRRHDESPSAMQSEEKAILLLEQELNGHISANSPTVGPCIARADVHIPNHGTLADLTRTVRRFFNALVTRQRGVGDQPAAG